MTETCSFGRWKQQSHLSLLAANGNPFRCQTAVSGRCLLEKIFTKNQYDGFVKS
jgi:hypothetical protein